MQKKSDGRLDRSIPYILSMASVFLIITVILLNFNNSLQEDRATSAESGQNTSVFAENSDVETAGQSRGYIVQEYNGMIGIFWADTGELYDTLDVAVSSLPKTDAALLKQGIRAETAAELQALMEDYES